VLVVFGASALLRSQNDLFFSLLATALIAALQWHFEREENSLENSPEFRPCD
jgi:hypothetical protein